MPLIGNGSLSQFISRTGKGLEEVSLAPILKEVLQALSYIHQMSIYHGNIKLTHILIDRKGIVKLTDVGMSLSANYPSKELIHCEMPPYWIGPEGISSRIASTHDVWSIGIVALEGDDLFISLVNRRFGTVDKFYAQPEQTAKANREFSKFSPQFKNFVQACLKTAVAKRPAAAELIMYELIRDSRGPEHLKTLVKKKSEPEKSDDDTVITEWTMQPIMGKRKHTRVQKECLSLRHGLHVERTEDEDAQNRKRKATADPNLASSSSGRRAG